MQVRHVCPYSADRRYTYCTYLPYSIHTHNPTFSPSVSGGSTPSSVTARVVGAVGRLGCTTRGTARRPCRIDADWQRIFMTCRLRFLDKLLTMLHSPPTERSLASLPCFNPPLPTPQSTFTTLIMAPLRSVSGWSSNYRDRVERFFLVRLEHLKFLRLLNQLVGPPTFHFLFSTVDFGPGSRLERRDWEIFSSREPKELSIIAILILIRNNSTTVFGLIISTSCGQCIRRLFHIQDGRSVPLSFCSMAERHRERRGNKNPRDVNASSHFPSATPYARTRVYSSCVRTTPCR